MWVTAELGGTDSMSCVQVVRGPEGWAKKILRSCKEVIWYPFTLRSLRNQLKCQERPFIHLLILKCTIAAKETAPFQKVKQVRFLVPTPQLIRVIVLLIIVSSSPSPKPHSGLSWVSNKGQGPLSEPVGHGMSMSGLS